MSWQDAWQTLWRGSAWPRIWAATMALLAMARSALGLYQAQVLFAWARGHGPRGFASQALGRLVGGTQLAQWVLAGLTAAALAWLYARLARQDPHLARRWPAGGRGWLVAFLRLVAAWVAFSVALWLGAAFVVPPLALGSLVLMSCGLWPFLVFALALWAVWWLMPWGVNFFLAAVLEHPASPATVVKRWWAITRAWAEDVFRPLASYSLLWILIWALPRVIGGLLYLDLVRAPAATQTLPWWWWPVGVGTAGMAAAGLAYVHLGWALAYLAARRAGASVSAPWPPVGGV